MTAKERGYTEIATLLENYKMTVKALAVPSVVTDISSANVDEDSDILNNSSQAIDVDEASDILKDSSQVIDPDSVAINQLRDFLAGPGAYKSSDLIEYEGKDMDEEGYVWL